MRLHPTKMLVVTCEILAKEDVIGVFKKFGATGYTSYEADGAGSKGERVGMVYSEKNVRIESVMPEQRCLDIMEELARTMFSDYAMIMHVSDVWVVRPEKFG